MNKILVSNNIEESIKDNTKYEFKDDNTVWLEFNEIEKNISLIISNNTKIVLNILSKNSNIKFNIKVEENASLILNNLILEGSTSIYVDLNNQGASFKLNYSILSSKNSNNVIEVKHKSSKTNAILKNHGFSSKKANLIFDVSAYIDKDASKCISKQDNKIIENENSLSQINPNLYIDNYDIEASHSAYVGEFKEEQLFYLMSRGLTEEESKFLLLKSFLIGSFDLEDNIKERYYHEVIKYFNKEV